jgi:hypothetical protein
VGWGGDVADLFVCLITSLPAGALGDSGIVETPGKEKLEVLLGDPGGGVGLGVLVGLGGGGADLGTAVDPGTPPEGIGGTCTVLEMQRTSPS